MMEKYLFKVYQVDIDDEMRQYLFDVSKEQLEYVIKKGYFEQIVGLQEEYKKEAKQVVEDMKNTNMIEGLDKIEKEIDDNPAIHKKLVRIARTGNYKSISEKDIKQMQKVCKKYGVKINVKNGKLAIEEKEDIDTVLKMLADYYKTGDVSGKPYGTFSGKEIKISN
jgi:hypothetical protein